MADLLIAIERSHRGRGLAFRLVKEILRHAARRRIALVRISYEPTNAAMARLTTRLGAVHSRTGQLIRAELCTGWIGEELVPPLTERTPGFRPL